MIPERYLYAKIKIMKHVFNQFSKKVNSAIFKASDSDLISDGFESEILSKFKLQFPRLDKANMETLIDEELVGFHNVPDSKSFYLGQKMQYIEINVPIEGCCLLFKLLSHDFYRDNKLDFCNATLSYREFRRKPIEGDDEFIAATQIKIGQIFDAISESINKSKPEAEVLFSNFIAQMQQTVKVEKEKRGIYNKSAEVQPNLT